MVIQVVADKFSRHHAQLSSIGNAETLAQQTQVDKVEFIANNSEAWKELSTGAKIEILKEILGLLGKECPALSTVSL